jgi:hypothetical protein
LLLGAALQIGFLKMSGRPLDAIQRVPADLLKHLADQIDVPAPMIATLKALYLKRRRTLYEHQRWAIGFDARWVHLPETGRVHYEKSCNNVSLTSLISGSRLASFS